MTPLFLFDITSISDWSEALGVHGWSTLVILLMVVVAEFVLRKMTSRTFRVVTRSASLRRPEDRVAIQQRADTLATTVLWVMRIVLFFVGFTLVLEEFGINVTALVAGVGVVGIAVGLGAQALVKDVINGTFILIEDQYRVGDVVTVANVSGTVLEINPRRTVLRDLDGKVHTIPNGAIVVATNHTDGFSRINLDIPIAYAGDADQAFRIIEEECERLRQEQPELFLSDFRYRFDAFRENQVFIKVMCDVAAGSQWNLAGILRRRIKARLDGEGLWMGAISPATKRTRAERHESGEDEVDDGSTAIIADD